MITFESLVAAGIGPTQSRQFLAPLTQACELMEINTPQRQAAFVAQCAHESSLFVHLEEDLYWRDSVRLLRIFPNEITSLDQAEGLCGNREAFANTVYANRMGNGPISSGDGYAFHGRGLIQITGRSNYTEAASDLHEPYIDRPELVAEPADACLTAAWFWARNRCNPLADLSDIDAITKVVNGPGMQGAQQRRDLFRRALQAFL